MTNTERLAAELISAERRVSRLKRQLLAARVEEATDGRDAVDVGFWAFLAALLGFPTRQERHWARLTPRGRDLIRALDPEAAPASDRR